jgi:hypothetical protein
MLRSWQDLECRSPIRARTRVHHIRIVRFEQIDPLIDQANALCRHMHDQRHRLHLDLGITVDHSGRGRVLTAVIVHLQLHLRAWHHLKCSDTIGIGPLIGDVGIVPLARCPTSSFLSDYSLRMITSLPLSLNGRLTTSVA